MRIRAMNARFEPAETPDCLEVFGSSLTQPERALAWAPRENHLTEARDLVPVTGPSAVLLEAGQSVIPCRYGNQRVRKQPRFGPMPVSEGREVDLEQSDACGEGRPVVDDRRLEGAPKSDKLIG